MLGPTIKLDPKVAEKLDKFLYVLEKIAENLKRLADQGDKKQVE